MSTSSSVKASVKKSGGKIATACARGFSLTAILLVVDGAALAVLAGQRRADSRDVEESSLVGRTRRGDGVQGAVLEDPKGRNAATSSFFHAPLFERLDELRRGVDFAPHDGRFVLAGAQFLERSRRRKSSNER